MEKIEELHCIEDGLRVIYIDGHRYEETAELDADGLAIFQYTGPVA